VVILFFGPIQVLQFIYFSNRTSHVAFEKTVIFSYYLSGGTVRTRAQQIFTFFSTLTTPSGRDCSLHTLATTMAANKDMINASMVEAGVPTTPSAELLDRP